MTAATTPFLTRVDTRLSGVATWSEEGTNFNNWDRCKYKVLLRWQSELLSIYDSLPWRRMP